MWRIICSDINGLTRIEYETGKLEECKDFILQALKESFEKAKNYYDL